HGRGGARRVRLVHIRRGLCKDPLDRRPRGVGESGSAAFRLLAEMTSSIDTSPPKNRRAGHRPEWLKIRVPGNLDQLPVAKLMNDLALNTVCQEARCPNIFECWSAGTATFMVLGEICTRRCTFCAVSRGIPSPVDLDEPRRVAEAVERMGVRHAVITMVNLDDMPDGGGEHIARTVLAARERTGRAGEVLISDL